MSIDIITVDKVTKRFGLYRALAGVDVELRAGSVCALLGPNGAGKSTLLGIVATLIRPTSGTVSYRNGNGASSPTGAELRRRIGVLAHESFVYGELSGLENLEFYGRLYEVDDLAARANALLDEVGLDRRARARAARTYSRGMTQRLALARALLHDPPLLLLDEPFTGLDRSGAAALSRALRVARDAGRVVLVVTHDFESLAGVCDHVVVLRKGKVVHDQRHSGEGPDDGFSYQQLKDIYHQFDD